MHLALRDLFRAKWTHHIHKEWMSAVSKRYDIPVEKLTRTRELMDQHIRDCKVHGYDVHIDELELPDPGDRHVLAAAIVSEAEYIVTFNTKHFPEEITKPYGVVAIHPDEFLDHLMAGSPETVLYSVRILRQNMTQKPKTPSELLETFSGCELPKFTDTLKGMIDLL